MYYIYILTNKNNTTFYIGVTNNIHRRIYQHLSMGSKDFVKRYQLSKLVYLEEYPTAIEAIQREKQLKNWHRQWKVNLIKSTNAEFKDLLDSETSSE